MTRKCAICKSKNYKNTYSFFSAPKDPDARRLWQKAINIKDYVVSDETFVCSKHFKKDDIITHWVSGVPPQVISIKYKKCRLRRGAIPVPVNIKDSDEISPDGNKYKSGDLATTEEVFNESSNGNLEDEIYEYIPEDSQEPTELKNAVSIEPSKKRKMNDNSDCQNELSSHTVNENKDIMYINCTDSNSIFTKDNEEDSIQIHIANGQNILTYFQRKSCLKNNEKESNKLLLPLSTKYHHIINSGNYWHVDSLTENLEISDFNQKFAKESSLIQEISDDNSYSILFEDFLEVYNEISLPNKWFASVICKGLVTTIVYSCMNISSTGMPYIEKKVFLNNDMTLRCGIFNKEIQIYSLLKNIKSRKVHSLSDIEDVMEEIDKIPLCIGLLDKSLKKTNNTVISFDDGIPRHHDCLLTVDKGCSICFNCSSLLLNNKSYHEDDT